MRVSEKHNTSNARGSTLVAGSSTIPVLYYSLIGGTENNTVKYGNQKPRWAKQTQLAGSTERGSRDAFLYLLTTSSRVEEREKQ